MFTNGQAYEGVDCKQEANNRIKTSFMRNEGLKLAIGDYAQGWERSTFVTRISLHSKSFMANLIINTSSYQQ